ncbi:MAG: hypothetical protein M1434_00395 [Chloroflexi bacterium]|nr:hypothetical protein [Chloroflexota bacterium]MCL5273194.1 hypothetical protein [Chloroflexota bacterium]
MEYPIDPREADAVHRVEQALAKYGPFVSLSEAARQTGVPLPTLADAVRHKRVPALRVQQRRWLVRVSAVRAYFQTPGDDAIERALQQKLVAGGLLAEARSRAGRRFAEVKPARYKGDKPLSETLVEERR